MKCEYYAKLADQKACQTKGTLPHELATGFVDECTAWSTRGSRERNEARRRYIQCVTDYIKDSLQRDPNGSPLALPLELSFDPDFSSYPSVSWVGLEVAFTLLTPWYSKDDRVFHVLDNPVRKDRVFGVPFMAAASWKGLLRWACRMQAGLRERLEKGRKFKEWTDCPWILHLFGNEKGETKHEKFREGALVFYPTWFDRIGFEVINPHSRVRRAGTQPIYYEVVPPGAPGVLKLLYAPLPGAAKRDRVEPAEAMEKLLEATEQLLTAYGISAKRTVGWGTANITSWKAWRLNQPPIQKGTRGEFWDELKKWFPKEGQP